ncbi:hypothetical protein FIBSPDRAFT_938886 [Athelia psychrophila]|uniref:BTB domain-containing protein n=1 Tax=Athelia psychrophila TaxID=1759441 RepID=A0A165XK02_9AGAM|nr:hypothetical protein FIBSPDRAFT_938886 [Fibularhizoctonia sp. CBS 109695]
MFSPSSSPSLASIASSGLSPPDEDFNLNSMRPLDAVAHIERPTISELVEDARDLGQIKMTHEDWLKFQASEKDRNVPEATSSAPNEIQKHAYFFLPAENIFFLVANTLYSVPRAPFERQSSAFTGKGLTEDDPSILGDVKAHGPTSDRGMTAITVDEWTAILHLAVRWGFEFIRTLATKHIAPIATEIDKIVLGRQYGIESWLHEAFIAVCMREQSLTEEEGTRMKVADIIRINSIRQQFGFGAQLKVADQVSVAEVCARFGLAAPGATIGSPLPLASEESKLAPSAHADGGLAVVQSMHGTEAAAPTHDSAMLAEEQDITARSKELKMAHRAKERQLNARMLMEYYNTSAYKTRLQVPSNDMSNVAWEAVKKPLVEIYTQDLRDFMATYSSENSESKSS